LPCKSTLGGKREGSEEPTEAHENKKTKSKEKRKKKHLQWKKERNQKGEGKREGVSGLKDGRTDVLYLPSVRPSVTNELASIS